MVNLANLARFVANILIQNTIRVLLCILSLYIIYIQVIHYLTFICILALYTIHFLIGLPLWDAVSMDFIAR